VDTVAHEINTPAGIITAQADAALLQMKEKNNFSEELNIIKNQTKRISKYTRSLLGYSKRVPFSPIPANLKVILDESVYLLGHRFRAKKIAIKKTYPPKLPVLLLDRNQMEQVFINVLNNAVDAIAGPGEIIIEVQIIRQTFKSEDDITEKEIKIDFIDNGKGISPNELNNLFKPFFSTKLPREGTGLGLYISKAIILRHRGKINILSDVGKGTNVSIVLPVNRKEI
jgi:two-component system NtrC family sensor kinase